jgi:hypothetical protein
MIKQLVNKTYNILLYKYFVFAISNNWLQLLLVFANFKKVKKPDQFGLVWSGSFSQSKALKVASAQIII